jgi:GTPase SAR1 family protein
MKNDRDGCNLLFVQVRQRTSSIDQSLRMILSEGVKVPAFRALLGELDKDAGALPVLRIAFAGEYDVGKSSLIKALTGEDLAIDADVTTDHIHTIRYKDDVVLIDMPGTLSGQLAHDRIAQQAIVDSDLMLFVVTNELFNPSSLPYFRQALDEFKKEKQTLLVVNQLDRINMRGRSIEDVMALLTTELAERVAPFPVEQFGPVFVSARDYLDAMGDTDDAERSRRMEESRMASVVKAIDDFCLSRGPLGRLARPLQIRLRIVNDAISAASSGDNVQQLTQEYLHRRLTIFGDCQRSFRLETRNLAVDVRHKIASLAEPVVALIERRDTPDAVSAAWDHADVLSEINHSDAMERLKAIAENANDILGQRLGDLNESAPAVALESLFNGGLSGKGKAGPLVDHKTNVFEKIVKDVQAARLLKEGGKKLVEHSGKISKTLVDWAGKFHKYRPWGKIKLGTKLAKWLGRCGKALGPLAIVAESYMNYRDEEKAEARERERMQFKAKVRAALAETADAACKSIEGVSQDVDKTLFSDEMATMRTQREDMARAAGEKQQYLASLTQLDGEIREALDLLAADML